MKQKKICLISSSGGHFEQLKMLQPLSKNYHLVLITEDTEYSSEADYYLIQTGMRDRLFPLKMIINSIKSIKIWVKEKPDYIISTGAMVVIPIALIAKLCKKKVVFIETFATVYDGTRTGRFMYKIADLFIVQWEPLKKVYPNAVYGGSIY